MATAEQLVDAYVKLRDMKKAMQEEHKKQLAPLNEKMSKIESGMLAMLKLQDAESMRCKAGTMYQLTRTSVKVEDWEEAFKFIRKNDLWHMLEHRLAKASVTEFVEANGDTPPGVSIVNDLTVGVRRS
jgi:hypothetical protein